MKTLLIALTLFFGVQSFAGEGCLKDFRGKWTGKCYVIGSSSYPHSVTIRAKNCSTLKMFGQLYKIGEYQEVHPEEGLIEYSGNFSDDTAIFKRTNIRKFDSQPEPHRIVISTSFSFDDENRLRIGRGILVRDMYDNTGHRCYYTRAK